jgi:hypothetical protein
LLSSALGRNGRAYFNQHYTWPVIEKKYLDMFDRLRREPYANPIEPIPGWFARRRQTLPPADEVVARVPTGPVLGDGPQVDAAGDGSATRRPASPPEEVAVVPARQQGTAAPVVRHHSTRPRPDRREERRPHRRRGPDRRPPRRSGN